MAGLALPDDVARVASPSKVDDDRFMKQRQSFRIQMPKMNRPDSSILFPPDILPTLHQQSMLARCMIPAFAREALPERRVEQDICSVALPTPRPGMACGFSNLAFTAAELAFMPKWLASKGTSVDCGTGSIASGSQLYGPYLSFERIPEDSKYSLEIAINQNAVNGAWAVNSQRLLFSQASKLDLQHQFDSPVAFSCCMNKNHAVLFYHHLDHAQVHCMSPIVRFELNKDEHFNQLLTWIEGIDQWAATKLLPSIKTALNLLANDIPIIKPPTPTRRTLKLDINDAREQKILFTALKTTYADIAWRRSRDEMSAVSSSTASWGSPVVNESTFMRMERPFIGKSGLSQAQNVLSGAERASQTRDVLHVEHSAGSAPSEAEAIEHEPQPEYARHTELLLKRRLGHAMEEIDELQKKYQILGKEFVRSTSCLQNELSGLRKTMTCVLVKEKMTYARRSSTSPAPRHTDMVPVREHKLDVTLEPSSVIITPIEPCPSVQWPNTNLRESVLITPTEPKPQRHWPAAQKRMIEFSQPLPASSGSRRLSNLKNVLTVDTSIFAVAGSCAMEATASKDMNDEHGGLSTAMPSPVPCVPGAFSPAPTSRLEARPFVHEQTLSPMLTCGILFASLPLAFIRVLILGLILDYCVMESLQVHGRALVAHASTLFH